MKLIVVGGVAGGASAAARMRRLDESAEIIVFERGRDVSFSNCCLPYHLSGMIESSEDLVLMTPENFRTQHNIDVRTYSEVISIDREKKTVMVKDLTDGSSYEEHYDKLVLASGANPILPRSIAGIDSDHVFPVRNVVDIAALKQYIDRPETEYVAVVGGGFIGVEVAENIRNSGKKVSLIEGLDQIMAPFDPDMVQILHKELDDHDVQLYLSSTVTAIEKGRVRVTRDGAEFTVPADVVVMSVGVAPETTLARAAGVEIGTTRGIKVNHNYQTSDPDIYAVGDAVELFNALTHSVGRLALAGPAQRAARAASDHMCGIPHSNHGYIGSSCVRIFSMNAASTGLNEKICAKTGYSYDSVLLFPNDMVGLMPDKNYMAFKLVFETPTGKILGAQAIGKGNVDKRIDVIAAMITMGATLEDLKELELCYAPPFGTAKDVVNLAALVGLNVLNGHLNQLHISEVRSLVESGAHIVDVRRKEEYEAGHIKGAHNIPLEELRQRVGEIPKDVPVYLHCRSSQRSYYAYCCLRGNGYRNITNISGSFLGLSFYEYFRDKHESREPIVTAYNFE